MIGCEGQANFDGRTKCRLLRFTGALRGKIFAGSERCEHDPNCSARNCRVAPSGVLGAVMLIVQIVKERARLVRSYEQAWIPACAGNDGPRSYVSFPRRRESSPSLRPRTADDPS